MSGAENGTSSTGEVHEQGCGAMHGEIEPSARTLSSDEIKAVRKMLDAYDKSKWLGGLMFKVVIGIGTLVGVLSTFKSQLLSLIRG
jgi:hypothetical protein